MKYIISENRINQSIESFLKERYPIVYKVNFKKYNVLLGSSEERPIIERTVIEIILNGLDYNYKSHELRNVGKQIRETLDTFFNLNIEEYGSEWDIELKKLAITPI